MFGRKKAAADRERFEAEQRRIIDEVTQFKANLQGRCERYAKQAEDAEAENKILLAVKEPISESRQKAAFASAENQDWFKVVAQVIADRRLDAIKDAEFAKTDREAAKYIGASMALGDLLAAFVRLAKDSTRAAAK